MFYSFRDYEYYSVTFFKYFMKENRKKCTIRARPINCSGRKKRFENVYAELNNQLGCIDQSIVTVIHTIIRFLPRR